MSNLRAITVCVDYSDHLAITMPVNRHHFSEWWVVTSMDDHETEYVAVKNGGNVLKTDAFYRDGAKFNKWRALETGLSVMGRHDWLCILDADIVWPKEAALDLTFGCLYTPFRRMLDTVVTPLPDESAWKNLPIHRQQREFAGYTQVFHADDPVLGNPPWHQLDWTHAGGADSFFQARWPQRKKVRPKWECLHLGLAGRNWCGRSTPRLDGSTPPNAAINRATLDKLMWERRERGNFDSEKILPHNTDDPIVGSGPQ